MWNLPCTWYVDTSTALDCWVAIPLARERKARIEAKRTIFPEFREKKEYSLTKIVVVFYTYIYIGIMLRTATALPDNSNKRLRKGISQNDKNDLKANADFEALEEEENVADQDDSQDDNSEKVLEAIPTNKRM